MNEKISAGISERFRKERERLGLTQQEMALAGHVAHRTLQGWEAGSFAPKAEFLAQAADIGVDVGYVITGRRNFSRDVGPPTGDADSISLPLLSATGSMGRGNDLITEDVILGNVPISRRWLDMNLPRSRPEALQLVHAYGDSMGETLRSGDFAIVDTDCRVADVSGVYVLQANGQLYIKRVSRLLDGTHEITSDNPNVRTVEVLNGSEPVRICGRVVYGWNGRRF
ncbi:S24 family peptidase [Acidovorax sp. SUPP2825]|uniref:XRE family transcriptional regulator n=1 Tax=Acidovorax sp. SUPP2825 TaxID=2920879 RepID=UPI0023DE1B80|nr:S24 family peptidase [Acidovorax sp. SUPP2825]GKS93215.1 helix-turn-helix domain-containing protein [Acidovorax sp. SUPP2825]